MELLNKFIKSMYKGIFKTIDFIIISLAYILKFVLMVAKKLGNAFIWVIAFGVGFVILYKFFF